MFERPLIVRCGAFGDMVLLTPLIRALHHRFQCPVDILTSGSWSEPLLRGQPGVGEILSVRSRKTPYWLAADQRRAVARLRQRGSSPTWYCDANDAARSMLSRAAFANDLIVDVADYPLLPGEHVLEQWRRMAQVMPRAFVNELRGDSDRYRPSAMGCQLTVTSEQQADLDDWLQARGMDGAPLLLFQVGNKRTMRRGLRRFAVNSKYWPNERWAAVLKAVRELCPQHGIGLLGTGPEYALNQEVAALANIPRLYNFADDLPISRLIASLARAAALITVDSGPAHAAAAVGCPQVVLFGKALPSLYRPWGRGDPDVKVLCGQIDAQPNMLGISTAQVIEACAGLKLRRASG